MSERMMKLLISPSKMCQNHTHTHTTWLLVQDQRGQVRRQVTNSQMLMYCARVSTKWKVERPITFFEGFIFFFFVVGVSVLRC